MQAGFSKDRVQQLQKKRRVAVRMSTLIVDSDSVRLPASLCAYSHVATPQATRDRAWYHKHTAFLQHSVRR